MPDDFDYSAVRPDSRKRTHDYPLITMLLMALSVVFTAAYLYTGSNPSSPMAGIAKLGVGTASDIWHGKYYILILSMFTHGSIIHIMFNMMWMWRLGEAIEAELHPLAYLGFVIAAALVGSSVEMCITGQCGIGMSGVVYAMFGLMWAGRGSFARWRQYATKDNVNLFLGWGVLCIFTTYFGWMQVANGAHFGGWLFGLCVGFLWLAPRKRPIFWAPLGALVVAVGLSVTWLPWTASWQWEQGNKAFDRKQYLAAIHHYNMAIKFGGDPSSLTTNLMYSWENIADMAIDSKDPQLRKQAMDAVEQLSKELAAMPGVKKGEADKSDGADRAGTDSATSIDAPGSGGE